MSFFMQYLRHPRRIGAVKASSGRLAEKMIEDIRFESCKCIVEIGAGTGAFTEKLIKARQKETLLLVFEINGEFFRLLRKKYRNVPCVHIIHDTAEHIGRYLKKYNIPKADYIVSGLPFASLPKEEAGNILRECRRHLNKDGSFITFQYTQIKVPFIQHFFKHIQMKKEYLNIPPAYVLVCKNQE